jgi:threonine/homoserine/homoserine lactone efflux protein
VPESITLLGFIAAALVVLLIPGPGVLYIVTRSLIQGQRAGLMSVLGLSVGALVHVAAATLGLSAILVTSATAFSVIKLLGAGYLVYLGIRAFMTHPAPSSTESSTPLPMGRLFTDGVIVSVLNPKIALFFLAFLSQFVDPGRGPVAAQVLFFGILYVLLALLTDGGYAVVASRLGHWLGSKVIQGPLPRYASGAVYIGLGVTMAFTDQRQG